MRLVVSTAAALAVLTAAALSSPPADAGPSARTIDRTFRCSTAFIGGYRSVTAKAHRGTGKSGSQWLRPALAAVTSGQVGSAFTRLDNSFAWVTAGRPMRDADVVPAVVAGVTYPIRSWGTLAWNVRLCRETKKPIPLTPAGLSGGAVGPFDEGFDCNTPSRVRVRIRGTFSAPGAFRSYRQFARITAPLSRAELAVRTDAGRPLAYAEVLASGTARLLTAKSCTPSG